ncbi:unnamed protein product [Clonostachys solani]|uniref:SNF2 N-terminal domain-containing protein n=1 Tax=Clonostachys solani TaxID=160281 RepID=A0A9N9Z6W9_9HYPO|nr:unnamed protein product [Clonostachys solani]
MGKSFASLNAALLRRAQLLADCGPVLVICPTSCVDQWSSEVQKHFNEETRPRCMALHQKETSPKDIVKMDIVIESHGFVRQRFTEATEYIAWFKLKDFVPQRDIDSDGHSHPR